VSLAREDYPGGCRLNARRSVWPRRKQTKSLTLSDFFTPLRHCKEQIFAKEGQLAAHANLEWSAV
jgi:hypothetical protein